MKPVLGPRRQTARIQIPALSRTNGVTPDRSEPSLGLSCPMRKMGITMVAISRGGCEPSAENLSPASTVSLVSRQVALSPGRAQLPFQRHQEKACPWRGRGAPELPWVAVLWCVETGFEALLRHIQTWREMPR